jgi:lipid-A-disaccharide synthase
MGRLTYEIAKRVIKVPFIGLPNLLANERMVPEFIQKEATPEKLTIALLDYLDHPEKVKELEEKFKQMHLQLRCNASQQAAQAIDKMLKKQ